MTGGKGMPTMEGRPATKGPQSGARDTKGPASVDESHPGMVGGKGMPSMEGGRASKRNSKSGQDVKTVELKNDATLYIYKDGKMAMEDSSGRAMSMKNGTRMETKKGDVIMMRGNELWRRYDPTRSVSD